MAAGDRHSLALTDRGLVFAWGAAQHGQLGIGLERASAGDQLRPVLVQSLADGTAKKADPKKTQSLQQSQAIMVHSICAGATMSAAVSASGELYLFGFSEFVHPRGTSNVVHLPYRYPFYDTVSAAIAKFDPESPPETTDEFGMLPVKHAAIGQAHIVVLTRQLLVIASD